MTPEEEKAAKQRLKRTVIIWVVILGAIVALRLIKAHMGKQ